MKQGALSRVLTLVLGCALALTIVPARSTAAPVPAGVVGPALRADRADPRVKEKLEEDLFDVSVGAGVNARARMKFAGTNGWNCLNTSFPGTGLVQVTLTGDVVSNVYVLSLALDVNLGGGKLRNAFKTDTIRDLEVDALERELVAVYGKLLDEAVEELAGRGVKPCTPKLKVKGKWKSSSRGITWEGTYEGERQLALREDGSFSASIPIAYSWSPIVVSIPGVGSATCTVSGGSGDTAELEGQFEDGDGTLKLTRMLTHGISGTLTSTCTVMGETTSTSMAAPSAGESDPAAQADVRIALQDGAQATFPLPTGGITGEVTLDLSYDDVASPSVAALPAVGGRTISP